jgi:acyl-CoA hydrolase
MDWPELPTEHRLSMTVLMTPDMANFSGNVHGGTILKQLRQETDQRLREMLKGSGSASA